MLECRESATGYYAFVVIHSTVRGPAIGGILFVPDYLINAGGLMTAGVDLLGWPLAELEHRVDDVYARTLHILDSAAHAGVSQWALADAIAAERLRDPVPVYVGRRHRPT